MLGFLPQALEEFEEATRYYEEREPGLGLRFRMEIESVCAAIIRQPLLWRERQGGFRRVNCPAFPYYIAFFLRGERIIVAAVAHSSRHPDYWKKRTE